MAHSNPAQESLHRSKLTGGILYCHTGTGGRVAKVDGWKVVEVTTPDLLAECSTVTKLESLRRKCRHVLTLMSNSQALSLEKDKSPKERHETLLLVSVPSVM